MNFYDRIRYAIARTADTNVLSRPEPILLNEPATPRWREFTRIVSSRLETIELPRSK
jgi:hypothetical protein